MFKKRPPSDNAVLAALESCQSNKRMKRMLIFGLRSLSELCTPPRGQFAENALEALNHGILSTFNEITVNIANDEELTELIVKVCWGITKGLERYNDKTERNHFLEENGKQVLLNILDTIPLDVEMVNMVFEIIDILFKIDIPLDVSFVLVAFGNGMKCGNLLPESVLRIFMVLNTLTNTSVQECAKLKESNADVIILSYIKNLDKSSDSIIEEIICQGLKIVGDIGRNTDSSIEVIMATKKIQDEYQNKKRIVLAGNEALEGMVSAAKLSNALQNITSTAEFNEKQNAFNLVNAIANIPSFIAVIVDSGAINLLVQVIECTNEQLSSGDIDEPTRDCLSSSINILGHISRSHDHAKLVYDAGGITAIVGTLKLVQSPEPGATFASCASALACVIKNEDYATELYNTSDVFTIIITALYNYGTTECVREGCIKFLESASKHKPLHVSLINLFTVEIVCYTLQFLTTNIAIQMSALTILEELVPNVYTAACIYEYGGFKGFCSLLTNKKPDKDVLILAFSILVSLSLIEDAKSYMSDGVMVDAVVSVMLEQQTSTQITNSGIDILKEIATEQDVERYLQILETSLTYASKDPETALKIIGGISAFSRIQRLSVSLTKKGVISCLVHHVAQLAQDKIVFQVNKQSPNSLPLYRLKLLTAEIFAIEGILSATSDQVEQYISFVFQSILVTQMKPLIEQHVKETEYIFVCLSNIVESHQFQDQKEINKIVVALLSGLQMFENLYNIPEIILSILLCLQISNPFVSNEIFVNNQVYKSVIKYMKEHIYNMRGQLVSLRLLYNLVSATPTLRDPLRNLGAVEMVKSVLRLSKMESESRSVAALLLTLLVPDNELLDYVSRNISDFLTSLSDHNMSRMLVSLRVLADFSACPSATRLMTRKKVQKHLKSLEQFDVGGEDAAELCSLAVQLIGALSSQPVALNDLREAGIHQYLLKCIQTSSSAGDAEGCLKGLHALRTVLDKHTEPLSMALKRNIVKVALQTPNEFPRHTEIMHGVATVLGTLCQEEDESLLASNPEFQSFIQQLNAKMAGSVDPLVVQSSAESLASLLKDANEMIKTTTKNLDVVPILLELLDKHTNETPIIKSVASCLDYLGSLKQLDLVNKNSSANRVQDSPLADICYTFRKCLEANLDDEPATSALLRGFCRFLSPSDGPMLRETGILNTVAKAHAHLPDSTSVNDACAEIVKLVSSDDLVMSYIQQLITADAENNIKALEDAIDNLNILLLTDLKDPDNCLKDEEQLWEILTRRLNEARSETRPKYIRSIVTLGERLVAQGKSDPNGYRGSWYYTQYMFPTQVEMLMNDEILSDTAHLAPPILSTMAEATSNPSTRQYAMQSLPISVVSNLLDTNVNNNAMAISSTKLLHSIGSDDEGIQLLKNSKNDIVPLLCKTMRAHRGRVSVVVPASSLLTSLASPHVGTPSKSLTNGEAFTSVEQGTSGNPDDLTVLDTAFMEFVQKAIGNPEIKPSLIKDDALRKALVHFETFRASKFYDSLEPFRPLDAENSLKLKRSFVNLLQAYAKAGEGALVGQKGGTQILLDMIQEPNLDPTVKATALETLVTLAESNPELAKAELMTTVASEIIPWINISPTEIDDLPPYIREVKEEPGKLTILPLMDSVFSPVRTSHCILNMLDAASKLDAPVGKHQIPINTFLQLPQTQKLLDEMRPWVEKDNDINALNQLQTFSNAQAESVEKPDAEKPENTPSNMNTVENPEDTDGLTLKKVYDFLVNRVENDLSIDVEDTSEPLLSEYAVFVLEKMTEYNDFRLEPTSFAGSESVWGAKAWELWLKKTPHIVNRLLQANVHVLLLDYIIKQQVVLENPQENHVRIATAPSSTLVALCEMRDPGALAVASVNSIASICTRNLTVLLEKEDEHTDDNFAPRLQLIQKTSIDRTIYEDPYIIEVFNRIWDLYDEGTLTFLTLIPLLRAFRAILCDNHMEYLDQSNTVQRLISELSKDYNTTLLIDGLFLLGIIGIDKKMKTVIGPRGVRVCLDILKNHMEDRPGEGVITNVQLALANIIVDEKQNSVTFLKEKGLQANVRVLQERGEHFDETNAASALLTNACFRRDDIKEEYGREEIGAPYSLSYAISCYDGSTESIAIRCLINLFKAISNMSLYTPNVDRFLQSGLEVAYYNLLEQSEALQDDVLNTCLFTLSNLTWENKEENMVKFGIIIPPLIKTLYQSQRTNSTLFLNTFATFIFLCRLETNCQSFAENGGMELTFHIVKTYGHEDLAIVQEGLSCFSVLARRPLILPYLNIEECFNLLKSVIEGDYFTETSNANVSAQTTCMAFRSLRRILTNVSSEYVGVLNQLGFSDALVWYFSCINSNADLLPTLFHEMLRVLIGLVSIGRGDVSDTQLTVDQFISDAIAPLQSIKQKAWFGRSNNAKDTQFPRMLEQPSGPRGYEVAGLDPHKCNEITAVIFNVAVTENMKKSHHRAYLVSAWLAYLASENIQEVRTFLFSNVDKIKVLLREYSNEFGWNPCIIIYTIYFIACLAYHDPQGFHQNFSKDSSLLKCIKGFSTTIAKTKENENLLILKQHYDEFLTIWTGSTKTVEALTQMEKFATYNVNLSISNWAIDHYPNGVHDLLIKDELRKGGTLTLIENERTKKVFQWKANQTLSLFRWCVLENSKTTPASGSESDFNVGVYITKISSISKGLVGDVLHRASKKMIGLSKDTTVFLETHATEEYPTGVHLSLKFKNKKNRDEFFSWMEEWKEASIA